ncbi:phospholipase DDHD1-like [Glandiceps talaboti]
MDYPAPGDQATREDDYVQDDSMESTDATMEVDVNDDDDDEVIPVEVEVQGEELREVAAGKLTISEAVAEHDVIVIEDSTEEEEEEEEEEKLEKDEPSDMSEEKGEDQEKEDNKADDRNTEVESSIELPAKTKINFQQPTDIVQDLNAGEVRWYYRESKEDRKWSHFIGYDSLQIEWKYRQIHFHSAKNDDNVDMIIVRGGLYEVDVVSKKCYPIYWEAEAVDVMRGTWFYDATLQPLEESLANGIEEGHLEKFRGQNKHNPPETLNIKGNKPILHHLKMKDTHVDWNSIQDVFLYSDTTRSKLARSIGTSFGLSKSSSSGTRLRRGYCLEAALDDKPPPISHLVFVVHGIGQKMDSSSIVKSCADLRATSNKMINKHLPSLFDPMCTKRVEFLPVEWRSKLRLDGDMVEAVTPHRLRGLRAVLNSSAMDIMYYTGPLYRSEIVRGLQSELNRLYKMFCERNEGFEANNGKVSVISHSLGSVITYDIITGWNPIHLYDQYLMHEQGKHPDIDELDPQHEALAQELNSLRKRVDELESQLLSTNQVAAVARMPILNFKVENLFCLGSPLAVFLSMRGIRPQGRGKQDIILPKSQCKRLFNIYHPADPVAYRIEPLLIKHYHTIMPLKINSSDSSKQKKYEGMMMMAYPSAKDKPKEMQSQGGSIEMPDMLAASNHDDTSSKKSPKSSDEETSSDLEDVDHSEYYDYEHPDNTYTAISSTTSTAFTKSPVSPLRSITSSLFTVNASSPGTASQDSSSPQKSPISPVRSVASSLYTVNGSPLKQCSSYPILSSVYDEMSASISASVTGFWSKFTKKTDETNPELQVLESMKEIAANDEREVRNEKGIPVSMESVASIYKDAHLYQELEHRIDYELREGTMENAYISAVTSHTAYWTSTDVALFVLSHLHPEYVSTWES